MPYRFPNGVYRVGGGVSVPRLLTYKNPAYTLEGRAAAIQGSVQLLVTIGDDGVPRDIRVQSGLGHGLDEMAIECVREWRFRPGEYEGAPVPVAATLNVTFKLEKTLPVAGSERHVGTAFLEVEKADDH